jgi:hypothetical protein
MMQAAVAGGRVSGRRALTPEAQSLRHLDSFHTSHFKPHTSSFSNWLCSYNGALTDYRLLPTDYRPLTLFDTDRPEESPEFLFSQYDWQHALFQRAGKRDIPPSQPASPRLRGGCHRRPHPDPHAASPAADTPPLARRPCRLVCSPQIKKIPVIFLRRTSLAGSANFGFVGMANATLKMVALAERPYYNSSRGPHIWTGDGNR